MDKSERLELLDTSRAISWRNFGKKIDFHLPGMITLNKKRGKYPALSITGSKCHLLCDHCRSRLLESMIPVTTPKDLVAKCIRLEKHGNMGCLISGGCLKDGSLPWKEFVGSISEVKKKTNLKITIHTGMTIDYITAKRLKDAGADQALIDIIGDNQTLRNVYHIDKGTDVIKKSLDALKQSGIAIAPHIAVGMNYGKIRGEHKALEVASQYEPDILVVVVIMPLPGTPMKNIPPPSPWEVAEILARARIKIPHTPISLGCARPRGKIGEQIELLAIDSGVNRMAIWSEEALKKAGNYGLHMEFHKTCCSV